MDGTIQRSSPQYSPSPLAYAALAENTSEDSEGLIPEHGEGPVYAIGGFQPSQQRNETANVR